MPQRLIDFDYQQRTRIVFGENSIDTLGEHAAKQGGSRVLLVTDRGIAAAGHAERGRRSLSSAGLEVFLFEGVHENPTSHDVDDCAAFAREAEIDLIVGLGGGSSMDTAKGCNFILTNAGTMEDYWGYGKAKEPMLPLIAVPTTAGTGSECQSYALISHPETHQKMACGDRKAAACVAILDPVLTLTQPESVTADTGIDALAHAVETAVTTKRTPLSALHSKEAFRLIQANLPLVFKNPTDLDARSGMLLGAAYGGMAIENSMLGAAHACANPLTSRYGIVHGEAVGMMLPAVMRFNAAEEVSRQTYCELAQTAGLVEKGAAGEEGSEAFIGCIDSLLCLGNIPKRLCDHGITSDAIPNLATDAGEQWTGKFNPRTLTVEDFQGLYESVLR